MCVYLPYIALHPMQDCKSFFIDVKLFLGNKHSCHNKCTFCIHNTHALSAVRVSIESWL